MYLVENGQVAIIWLGRLAPASWIQGVMGVPSLNEVDTQQSSLPALNNSLSDRVRQLLQLLRADANFYMPVSTMGTPACDLGYGLWASHPA